MRTTVSSRFSIPESVPLPTRQLLGLGVLLATLTLTYTVSREITPPPPPLRRQVDLAPAARRFDAHVQAIAGRHGLPAELVMAIIDVESAFRPRAVSPKGARGLMQVMPATAADLGVRDVSDATTNIDVGARHLRRLMERFEGDLPLVLAAYNAGENAVLRHCGIPPYRETQEYVVRVLARLEGDMATKATSAPRYQIRCSRARPV
jgi:soluble lytic murein transglycosylase-like protein